MQTPEPSNTGLPPAIGQLWPEQGGVYAGIARGFDGQPDHHLILSATKADAMPWQRAMDWAGALLDGAHNDWALPTRPQSALLFANLRDQFEQRWHWTNETYEGDGSCAWVQYFDDGCQDVNLRKSYEGPARAVRRLPLQSFDPS